MSDNGEVDRRALITGVWRLVKAARQVIRPPGAVNPDRFFELCDGCAKCAEICPADAIVMFGPAQKNGNQSPEIRVNDAACVMCDGLVCTTSCPTGALEPATPENMRIGRVEFNMAACWVSQNLDPSCNYCFDRCPLKGQAITFRNKCGPEIHADSCTGCGTCVYFCPSQPKALTLLPID